MRDSEPTITRPDPIAKKGDINKIPITGITNTSVSVRSLE
jgi:hypothetical protein